MTSSLEGEGGGSGYPPKVMTSFSHYMMTRGRGSGYPPKVMTSFMNSPLLIQINHQHHQHHQHHHHHYDRLSNTGNHERRQQSPPRVPVRQLRSEKWLRRNLLHRQGGLEDMQTLFNIFTATRTSALRTMEVANMFVGTQSGPTTAPVIRFVIMFVMCVICQHVCRNTVGPHIWPEDNFCSTKIRF